MFKKSLLILSAALSLSGSCALAGTLHLSAPAQVYATSEDDDDYDYLEIYDNTEEDTSAASANTDTSGESGETSPIEAADPLTPAPAPAQSQTTAKPHVLDSTPKTADFEFTPQLALSLGVFFLGLSIFFLAQRKQK